MGKREGMKIILRVAAAALAVSVHLGRHGQTVFRGK